MPLGFLYQVLSLSSDLIPVLSDLGLGFRFVFLNSISFLFVFLEFFFKDFVWLMRIWIAVFFFFFWGLWIGLVWKIWDCYLLLILYGDEIRWSWNSVLFTLRGLLLDFLCIIAAFSGLWNFGSWNLDILWVSSIRVRIKIRCLFLRVMTCELVGF